MLKDIAIQLELLLDDNLPDELYQRLFILARDFWIEHNRREDGKLTEN